MAWNSTVIRFRRQFPGIWILIIGSLIVVGLLLSKIHTGYMQKTSGNVLPDINHPSDNVLPDISHPCREKHQVVFIKVHMAGSDTITSIISRFGIDRKLTFALPKEGFMITTSQDEPLDNVMMAPDGQPFDILCNHIVYSRSNIESIMAPNPVYITIVQEPAQHLHSALYYFFPDPRDNKVQEYLRSQSLDKNNHFRHNFMAYELGLPEEDLGDETKISRYLEKLDKEMAIIMVAGRMEESVLLLKRYMCWDLQDVLYMPKKRNKDRPELNISVEDMEIIGEISKADSMLYDFSVERLDGQINQQHRFYEELAVFKSILHQVNDFCQVSDIPRSAVLDVPATKWNNAFTIYSKQCEVMKFGRVDMLNYVRRYQYL